MAHSSHSRCSALVVASAFLVGSLLYGSGCGKDAQDKLKGRWIGDRIENVDESQVARATGWVKGASLEFAGDKLTVTIPAEAPRAGTFKVTKQEGEKLVLAVTRSEGTSDDATTLTMADEKTMRWDIGQGREIVLVRAQ